MVTADAYRHAPNITGLQNDPLALLRSELSAGYKDFRERRGDRVAVCAYSLLRCAPGRPRAGEWCNASYPSSAEILAAVERTIRIKLPSCDGPNRAAIRNRQHRKGKHFPKKLATKTDILPRDTDTG